MIFIHLFKQIEKLYIECRYRYRLWRTDRIFKSEYWKKL